MGVACAVLWDVLSLPLSGRGFNKSHFYLNGLERPAKEGDSPVRERDAVPFGNIPSNACHGKTGVNLGGPSPKTKDYSETDSELSSASER